MRLFISKQILLEDNFISGGILVNNGKIIRILNDQEVRKFKEGGEAEIFDAGNNVIMTGVIDSHVHVNEPGRTEWEGYESATKAAAAGGITTIVDMPLNSIPPTTTLNNLKTKLNAAKGKVYVDVAFWGGVIPGNQENLQELIEAGVVGFKCFLCPSGVDEFPNVTIEDVEIAMVKLEHTNVVLAFHAELEESIKSSNAPNNYASFLEERPASMEDSAIKVIIDLTKKYNVRTHIVHLSSASALPYIESAKLDYKLPLTVETCHHYLNLTAEEVPAGATQFKCCPPVRDANNRELLWGALKNNIIDMVVSDHSPCTPDLKLLSGGNLDVDEEGNFLKAWGGIASVQFGLNLFWTQCKSRAFPIHYISKYMSRATAELVGLHTHKGKIAENYDADFVIWDPTDEILIEPSMIYHKNKVTPYMDRKLCGKILTTVVGGNVVYENGTHFGPNGKLLINV